MAIARPRQREQIDRLAERGERQGGEQRASSNTQIGATDARRLRRATAITMITTISSYTSAWTKFFSVSQMSAERS
jgi:hypothetical protein